MNAINLIPAGQRRNRRSISAGAPFLALVAGLLLLLVASSAYVLAHNRVESRKAKLAALQATTVRWSSAASSYATVVAAEKRNEAAIDGVKQLVGQRANWSELLGQLAEVMPAHSQLASLSTTASTANAAGTTTPSTTTPSTGTSTAPSGTSTASAGTSTASSDATSIALSACATNQSVVAETLIALRRITGVSQVSLSTSGSGGSTGGSSGSGNCDYPVPFQVTLTFEPPTFASGTGTTQSTSVAPSTTTGTSGVSQ